MELRFAFLGSGSRGNGLLVEAGDTCLLVDCGFSIQETERRLARLHRRAENLAGILVTHEHSDHIGGVARLALKYRLSVWLTPGTRTALPDTGLQPELRLFNCHTPFVIGEVEVSPFPVPHDAREPSQFVFAASGVRLGLLTDVGTTTPHIEAQLSGCEGLILECNHDPEWLANGSYPPALKRRVAGRHGHLSNQQAGALLGRLDTSRLQLVVAAHLSEKHNTPQMARSALSVALGCEPDWIAVAGQGTGLDWRGLA